jgi:threonine dehydrogenase-like Zn-dependent dehydrogenase
MPRWPSPRRFLARGPAWHGAAAGTAGRGVVVIGGGAIGLTSALVARHFGAKDLRVGETNPLRRDALRRSEDIETYAPGSSSEPAGSSVDLVIDAVGAAGTRAAASRMARPGGVIVHLGLLPGNDGLDVQKITLQEIAVTGSYCYTPIDFRQTVAALAARQFGQLHWFQERPLSEGAGAFASIDRGSTAAAKIILRPWLAVPILGTVNVENDFFEFSAATFGKLGWHAEFFRDKYCRTTALRQ